MSFEAAQRIRSLLTERGLSERQASIASGLSPATVNALLKRLEAGSGRIEQRTVDALAATLGVSSAWMLHGIGDADAAPPPPQEEMMHELRHGRRAAAVSVLEALADHAHEVADGDGPEGLARGQKVEVVVADLPSGVSGLLTDRIYVRRGLPREVQVLVILHELAHAMLRAAGLDDPHGDVWPLALALAAPRSMLTRLLRDGDVLPADLAAASGVPWWAASERLDMTPVIFCVYGG